MRACGSSSLAALTLLFADAHGAKLDDRTSTAASSPLPAGKTLSIEVTVGTVRIEGWDRTDAEITIERHAPAAGAIWRGCRSSSTTRRRASAFARRRLDGGTDPALRADVIVRVPRAAVIDRVQVLEGRIAIESASPARSPPTFAAGPIDGKDLSGTLRLEAGIGSVMLTDTRLSADGLLRLRAFNGDVRLTLAERPADARIMALALNGDDHVGHSADAVARRGDRGGARRRSAKASR